jgi:hypothetical protein
MRAWIRRTTQISDSDIDEPVQETYDEPVPLLDHLASRQAPRP